jgi:hypothetical protein
MHLKSKALQGLGRLWRRISWRPRRRRPFSLTLGRYLDGTAAGFCIEADGSVVLPEKRLRRHVVMVGNDRQGKDLATLLLCDEIVRQDDRAQLFVFDTEGDPELAGHVKNWMSSHRRRHLSFPDQSFDLWAGQDWHPIWKRLSEIIRRPSGDGRPQCVANWEAGILRAACSGGAGPPRSAEELLQRLSDLKLASELLGLRPELVDNVYKRCQAVFSSFGTTLDGRWSFRDVDSAFFRLDALSNAEGAAMRMLNAQLLRYITHEKDPARRAFVVMRIAGSPDLEFAKLLEVARARGVIVVLQFETSAEAGNSSQIRRLGAIAGTVILQGPGAWHDLEQIAGPGEPSDVFADGRFESVPTSAWQGPRITKEELLHLPPGRGAVLGPDGVTIVEISPRQD